MDPLPPRCGVSGERPRGVSALAITGRNAVRVLFHLHSPGILAMLRAPMSNRAIWSMRKRHEWLATPLKKKRVKKATRLRCGLQDAMDRKGPVEAK